MKRIALFTCYRFKTIRQKNPFTFNTIVFSKKAVKIQRGKGSISKYRFAQMSHRAANKYGADSSRRVEPVEQNGVGSKPVEESIVSIVPLKQRWPPESYYYTTHMDYRRCIL